MGLLPWRALTWGYSDRCCSLGPSPMEVSLGPASRMVTGLGLLPWMSPAGACTGGDHHLGPGPMEISGLVLLQQRKSQAQACSSGCPFHYISYYTHTFFFYSHRALGLAFFPLITRSHYLSTHHNFIVLNLYLSLLQNLSQQLSL